MMTKLNHTAQEPAFETSETLVYSHLFSERDLERIDLFLRVQKQTGTLTINYANGGKTAIKFVQSAHNERVKL